MELGGVLQPAAAPRFSRTPGAARPLREDGDSALAEWGVGVIGQARLRRVGVLGSFDLRYPGESMTARPAQTPSAFNRGGAGAALVLLHGFGSSWRA